MEDAEYRKALIASLRGIEHQLRVANRVECERLCSTSSVLLDSFQLRDDIDKVFE